MGNQFVHVELMATDVGKAKSFYGELFDWNQCFNARDLCTECCGEEDDDDPRVRRLLRLQL